MLLKMTKHGPGQPTRLLHQTGSLVVDQLQGAAVRRSQSPFFASILMSTSFITLDGVTQPQNKTCQVFFVETQHKVSSTIVNLQVTVHY